MPAGTRHQCAAWRRHCTRQRRLCHRLFDGAAILVQPVKLGSDPRRFAGIVGGEQSHAQICLANAPAGIHPRPQRKAEVARHRRPAETRRIAQRRNADIGPAAHHLQSLRDKRAIQPHERRHIGHGAQCDQIDQFHQIGLVAVGKQPARPEQAIERHAQQKRYAHRCQMAMRGRLGHLVEPVGVHQRQRRGQGGAGLVVIDHDHIQASRVCRFQRLETLRAAIHSDHQISARLFQRHQRLCRGAIALQQPVRDIVADLAADAAQITDHDGGRCRPVHVIIAIDDDIFARLHRIGDALGGAFHIGKDRRIGQPVAQGRGGEPGEVLRISTAGAE